MATTQTEERRHANIVIAPDEIDKAFMAAVSALKPPPNWDVLPPREYLGLASRPKQAVIVLSATDGPTPRTKAAVVRLVARGVRNLIIVLYRQIGAFEDEEITELVEMEIRSLVDAYGFPQERVRVVRLKQSEGGNPSNLWRTTRRLLKDATSGVVSATDAPPTGRDLDSVALRRVAYPRELGGNAQSTGRDAAELASLSVIRSAPGRFVQDGHATAMAAYVDGVWWAPEFQFVEDSRELHGEVFRISEKLGGREDMAGVLSWWLTTNLWLDGERPSDLVGHGRTAELVFAADQVSGGNW